FCSNSPRLFSLCLACGSLSLLKSPYFEEFRHCDRRTGFSHTHVMDECNFLIRSLVIQEPLDDKLSLEEFSFCPSFAFLLEACGELRELPLNGNLTREVWVFD